MFDAVALSDNATEKCRLPSSAANTMFVETSVSAKTGEGSVGGAMRSAKEIAATRKMETTTCGFMVEV